MKLLSHIPAWLKNKYFLSITGFITWMLFFDPRDIFTQMEHKHELNQLLASKAWYQKEISKETTESELLKTNPAIIEKYSREKFLMKKDNEDLYLVPEKPVSVNK
jgi:cell division protein DivIC